LLHDLVASGRHAVILSTHLVGGLDTLCTDVAFMAQGRIALRWGATELSMARAEAGGFENAVMRRIAGADLAEIVD